MIKYDIVYSLNKSTEIEANTYEEAEAKLREKLLASNIDLSYETGYTLEVFDVVEEELLGACEHCIMFGRFERDEFGFTKVYNDNNFVGSFKSEATTKTGFENECENYISEGGKQ